MTNTSLALMRPGALLVLLLLASSVPAQAWIEMDTIGQAGNPADSNGLGSVATPYRMARFEVTNAQYVEFLNAVAAADPNGLYNTLMSTSGRGGIERSGLPGVYTYALKPGFADKPVVALRWMDGARFCNWLQHGRPTGPQGPGTTDDGAYDSSLRPGDVARKPGALFFIPTHDEWYKAAYFDPFDPGADAGGTPDYWHYPTRSDSLPSAALADAAGNVVNPGPNVANHSKAADWNGENGNVTTVGGAGAISPWGIFDLGGNVNEQTETLGTPIPPNPPTQPDELPTRRIRGGDFANTGVRMGSPAPLSGSLNMEAEGANVGLRVAGFEPFADLGGALPGSYGPPLLAGAGLTEAGFSVSLLLSGALENSPTTLVIGFSLSGVPFKGGTLVPSPDLLILGLVTDPAGALDLSAPWPAGVPSGVSLAFQHWVTDPAGPAGLSASNGLSAVTP